MNILLAAAGLAAFAAGCWLIYPPAALLSAGLGIGGFGLFRDAK